MAAKPKTVDEYIAAAPADKRTALKKLRRTIKAAAPDATEYLGYGLAGFKHQGKPLIYFGYAKEHLAVYGPAVVRYSAELKGYDASKGTVRFTPEKPLPDRLLAKLVKDRLAEIEGGRDRPYAAGERRSRTTTRPSPIRDAKTSVLTRKPTKMRSTPSSSPR